MTITSSVTSQPWVGTAITYNVQFLNAANEAQDPLAVNVSWNLGSGLGWTTWVYGTDAEVERIGIGNYTATVYTAEASTSQPRISAVWRGLPVDGVGLAAVNVAIMALQAPPD